MTRTNQLANQIADRSAATLIAGLLVATLFGNAMLWVAALTGA